MNTTKIRQAEDFTRDYVYNGRIWCGWRTNEPSEKLANHVDCADGFSFNGTFDECLAALWKRGEEVGRAQYLAQFS